MRILVLGYIPKEIGGSYTTGIANVVLELCRCKCEGVDLMCFASNASEKTARNVKNFVCWGYTKNVFSYICYVLGHPVKTFHSWLYYKKKMKVNPARYMFYQINMERCIKTFNPDIIHAMTYDLLPTAKLIVGYEIPCVVTFHGFHYKKIFNTPENDQLTEVVMPLCDEVTALTQEVKDDILKSFPKSYKHLSVIPNGCDTSKFYYSPEERTKIRMQLGIKDNTPVFITVGGINENKGQLRFVQYLHMSGIKDYKYLIIGKGDYEDKIRAYIIENDLDDNVYLLGYISNIETYKYHSASDFYAQASEMEGQSLAELEAESTGLRIIVNKSLIGTIPCNVFGKVKYYVMDFNHPDYTAFEQWLNLKSIERKSIDVYDWKYVFDKYVDLYRKILIKNNHAVVPSKCPQYTQNQDKDSHFIYTKYIKTKVELDEEMTKFEILQDAYIFRGMNDATYKMYASSQRHWIEKTEWIRKIGKANYYDFIDALIYKTSAIPRLKQYIADNHVSFTELFTASMMQHFGAPSPMLDFSMDLYKGLFFAIDGCTDPVDETDNLENYFSLYLLPKNLDGVQTTVQKVMKQAAKDIEVLLQDAQKKDPNTKIDTTRVEDEIRYCRFRQFRTDNNQSSISFLPVNGPDVGSVDISISSLNFQCKYEIINDRILSQQGMFIMNLTQDVPLVELMNKACLKKIFICLNIHKSLKQYVIDTYLSPRDINEATVYCKDNPVDNALEAAIKGME